jgi:phage shock protein PspC (stress-responsive transcriptional regulator)
VFAAVLRDAWRQYRRRPLAAVVAVAIGGLPVFFDPRSALVAVPFTVALLLAGLLVELFLVAWLARPRPPTR